MSSSGTQRAASPNDAQWLTEQLRSSRLTVLCGEAGDSMTELLTSGVLPQLQRRAVDRQPPPPPSRTAQVLPFPDRRAARSEAAEVCIYFDHWGESPRHALVERLLDAIGDRARRAAAGDGLPVRLGEKLSALSQRFGLRILLVLDRFDECLTAPAERPDLRALRDEILAAINLVQSPVQFLLVLREDGEPLLHQLRRRIEGFDAVRKPLPGTQASVRGPAEFSSIAAQAPQPTQPPDARPTGRTEAVYASIAGWLERSARTRAPQAAAPAGPAKPVDEAAPEPFDGGAPPAAQAIELPAFAGEPRGAAPGLEFAAPLREPVTLEPAGAAAREPAQAAQRPQRAAAAAPPLPGAATAPPAVQPLHAVAVSGPVPPATSSESPAGLERIAAEVADDVQTWAEHDDEPGEFHALSVVVPGEPDAPTIPRPAAEVPAEAEREAPSQVQAEAMQVSSTDAAQTAPTEAVQAAPAEVEPTARPEPEPAVPATLVEAEPTAPTEAVAGGSIDAVLAPPAPQPSGMEAVATAGDAGQALAWAGRAEEDDAPDAPAGRHPEEVGLPAAEPAEAEAADAEQVRAGPAAGTAPRQAEAVPGASDTAPSASDAAPNPAAAVPSAAETAPPRVHAAAPITFAAEPADLAPQASDSMPPRAMAELDAEAPLDAGASAAAEPANAGTAATPDREAEAEQADEPPQRMRYDEHPFEPDSSLFADTRPGPDHPDDEAPTAPLARDFAADDAAAS
ncbi:MAG TPA: hypothetical protein VFR90_06490, partial [Methylibium sp.]|nr:hypothetical protein [Methylibium sp.]